MNRYGGWVLEAIKENTRSWPGFYLKACGAVQRLNQLVTGACVSSTQIMCIGSQCLRMEIACRGGRWEGMVLSVCILGRAIHRTFHPVLPHHTDCRDLEHPQGHPQKNPWGIQAVCSPSYLHFLPLSSLTLLPKVRSQQTFPSNGSQRKFLSKKGISGGRGGCGLSQ